MNSWNAGSAKKSILDYVEKVTQPGSSSFINPEDRIAVFDNDGTLWEEKPFYAQVAFAFEKVKELAPQHPEWKATQPFKAVLENDFPFLAQLQLPDAVKILAVTHAGMTNSEFQRQVDEWLKTARNQKFGVHHTDLAYKPMLELLQYLRANEFKTYIVTGGGVEFVQQFSREVYGIPPEQVIGSAVVMNFIEKDGGYDFMRLPNIVQPIDDGAGKPVNIQRALGRPPVIAVGNSDGDLQMLQFSEASPHPSLQILIHHDDATREVVYDKGAEKILMEARNKHWTIVSMKDDFQEIFSKAA